MALLAFSDGGSRNNPGEAGIGGVITREGAVVAEISEYLGIRTNNWAEYQGVIRVLETIIERGFQSEPVEIRLDSKLVVEQLNRNWKIKEPTLQPQAARAWELIDQCTDVTLTHIPREKNKDADRLANEAMDKRC